MSLKKKLLSVLVLHFLCGCSTIVDSSNIDCDSTRRPSQVSDSAEDASVFLVQERGNSSGAFIVPNEYHPSNFSRLLRAARGTLLGVGTFRMLFDFGMGGFDTIVFFDHDEIGNEFSSLNVDLILEAEDRLEYIRALFGISKNNLEYQRLRRGQVSLSEFLAKSEQRHILGSRPEGEMSPAEFNMYKFFRKYERKSIDRELYGLRDFLRINESEFRKQFLGDDQAFNSLKKKLGVSERYFITGNIVGVDAWQGVVNFLRARGKVVGAVDLSNAQEYFKNGKDFEKLAENLSMLPASSRAVLLSTHTLNFASMIYAQGPFGDAVRKKQEIGDNKSGNNWVYVGSNLRGYVRELSRFCRSGLFKENGVYIEGASYLLSRFFTFLGTVVKAKVASIEDGNWGMQQSIFSEKSNDDLGCGEILISQ